MTMNVADFLLQHQRTLSPYRARAAKTLENMHEIIAPTT